MDFMDYRNDLPDLGTDNPINEATEFVLRNYLEGCPTPRAKRIAEHLGRSESYVRKQLGGPGGCNRQLAVNCEIRGYSYGPHRSWVRSILTRLLADAMAAPANDAADTGRWS